MDKALSVKRAAEILGCTAGVVRGRIKYGHLGSFQIDGATRIRQSRLEKYMAEEELCLERYRAKIRTKAMRMPSSEPRLVRRPRIERRKQLKALLDAGKDAREIAEDLGIGRGEVGRLMSQWGLSRAGRRQIEFGKLLSEGKSIKEIAKKYGICRVRVGQLIEKWGFSSPVYPKGWKLEKRLNEIEHLEKLEIGVEYERGATIGEIMAGHELDHLTVREILKRQETKFSSSLSRRIELKFSRVRQLDICRAYEEGVLIEHILRDYEVSFREFLKILQIHQTGWRSRGICWNIPSQKKELVRKICQAANKRPNKAELKLNRILQLSVPEEYTLNVRGDVLILGGKVPDFVNVNGQKKLIEMNGDYWHKGEDPQIRINYFKQFGYNTLVVWEHELEDESSLAQKLADFNGSPLPVDFPKLQRQLQFSFTQEACL